jgi:hypothetical protein
MKKLLVSGCSVTHGAELFNKFMHPENIKSSYSQHLADQLGCELVNVAMSAASNEYIFHSLIEEISKQQQIHSVIVMWTSTGRLHWKRNNRHYFFLGNFASSMIDPYNFKMHDKNFNDCWFTGDNNIIVDKIAEHHKFIVTDYFDNVEENKKLKHYSTALNSICSNQRIKLVELDWNFIDGSWQKQGRHPNFSEHQQVANKIYREYYENKQ